MKQKIIVFFIFIVEISTIYAQKEVYFTNIKQDSIKVESLKGLETNLSYEILSSPAQKSSIDKSFSVPLYIGYFSEIRIAPHWTLTSRVGLYNTFGSRPVYYVSDSVQNNINADFSKYKLAYSLKFGAGIEPRYYLGFNKRALLGKAKLNSGWFLALPLSLKTTLFQTTEPLLKMVNTLTVEGDLVPTLGFRKAISSKWFLEGSIGIKASSSYNSYTYYATNVSYFQRISFTPEIKIKAAYIFK